MSSLIGSRIGRFRVVDQIGLGGMGEVYVGFDEKLERKVALKAIRAEHRLDAESKARLLREARILSQLDHPNICQIFEYIEGDDADVLALELVDGRKLTQCIPDGIELRMRLPFAQELASVLVAAHGKGIVHRDLKPDNVMVTADGHAKVLDFGLSRTLDGEQTTDLAEVSVAELPASGEDENTLVTSSSDVSDGSSLFRTSVGSVVGTLGYMSPEQASGEPASAASDVYSLGLVFQELFSGERAFDRGGAIAVRLDRARKGESRPAAGFDPDLVALVERMKARVAAARPSAIDVEERLAWIRNKPRRRTKRLLIAASMVVLALFGASMTVLTLRARSAEREAAREAEASRKVSEFLVDLFDVSDPSESRGKSVTARELLDKGAGKIDRALRAQPEIRARLMSTMGRVYWALGLYADAEPLLEGSLAARVHTLGPDHPDVAESLNALGSLRMNQYRKAEAERCYRRALAIREKALGPDHPLVADSLNNLANVCLSRRSFEEAGRLYDRAEAIRQVAFGAESSQVADVIFNRGNLLSLQGRNQEAEKLYRRFLGIAQKTRGADDPGLGGPLTNLGWLVLEQGRIGEARELFRRALAISERPLGAEHPDVASSLYGLAFAAAKEGKRDEALTLLARALPGGGKTPWMAGIAKEPDLELLHGDPEFERIVAAVEHNRPAKREGAEK